MNLYIEDTNEIEMRANQEDGLQLRAGDTINLGSSDYNDLTNKPSIDGTELVGDVSLEDIGAASLDDIPTKVSDLENDAGYITENDIPPIPDKTSDLVNDSGFITANDIPPLITDLGYIDPEEYEEDVNLFMNTLKKSGFYKFTFGGDDLTYFVAVQAFDSLGGTFVNQHYWGDEEGPTAEYFRALFIEDDEVVDEQTTSYLTMEGAIGAFASKSHVHYRTASASLSVWDYCNGSQITLTTDSPILYTDMRTPRHAWFIETTSTVTLPNRRFIKLTDLHDASVTYQRSGAYSNGVITWGDWYKFSGTVYTP